MGPVSMGSQPDPVRAYSRVGGHVQRCDPQAGRLQYALVAGIDLGAHRRRAGFSLWHAAPSLRVVAGSHCHGGNAAGAKVAWYPVDCRRTRNVLGSVFIRSQMGQTFNALALAAILSARLSGGVSSGITFVCRRAPLQLQASSYGVVVVAAAGIAAVADGAGAGLAAMPARHRRVHAAALYF